jgi:hypothetical protein
LITTQIWQREILLNISRQDKKEVGDSPYRFEGGDAEIVAKVHHQMAVEHGEVVEVDSDDEDGGEGEEGVSIAETIQYCNLKVFASNMVQWRIPLICHASCITSEVI